jgi:TetR/AcrR family acrAB operon transcriptional repressor
VPAFVAAWELLANLLQHAFIGTGLTRTDAGYTTFDLRGTEEVMWHNLDTTLTCALPERCWSNMHGMAETPARPSRAVEKAAATRQALVDLAVELFAEQGYMQTSIRDIARRGAVTSGAIYGHFRNKADLLVEAISQRTAEELESQTIGVSPEPDYIETLTRTQRNYPDRRQLRALILQGAAASLTDEETRERLREEQLGHLETWVAGYEETRDAQGIDPTLDMRSAVQMTYAIELGLGVLEAMGIEPARKGWADAMNRVARGLQLPPDDQVRRAPRKLARKRR